MRPVYTFIDISDIPPPVDSSIPEALPESMEPPPVTRETPDGMRAAAREVNRLAFHESRAICHGCAHESHVARQYRCRWCGVYFCAACSMAHFSPTAVHVGPSQPAGPTTI